MNKRKKSKKKNVQLEKQNNNASNNKLANHQDESFLPNDDLKKGHNITAPLLDNRKYSFIVLLIILLIAGVLAFFGITNHLFWDDEANTAIFAKNLLEFGQLTAWDGKNLIAYKYGSELSDDLINVYMPPLHYYITAASFFLFGQSTFTGRLPFVVLGLLTIVFLYRFVRNILDRSPIAHLSCLLLSVNVAFLLYIRNCRYYSLTAFFSILLLCYYTEKKYDKKNVIKAHIVIALSVWALFLTNYFNAISASLTLGCFFLLSEYRNRHQIKLFATAMVSSGLMGMYTLIVRSPFHTNPFKEDTAPAAERFFTFVFRHVRDLGLFEFFPLLVVVFLLLPFVLKRLFSLRQISVKALTVLLCMAVTIVVVSITTPQILRKHAVMDMRYLIPLIPLGAVVSSVSLYILWRFSKIAGLLIFLLLVFSNIPYLAFLPIENDSLPPKGFGCTICKYMHENIYDYTSSTERITEYLKSRPQDKYIIIDPGYLAYPQMFHLSEKFYCNQIGDDKKLTSNLTNELPEYIFSRTTKKYTQIAMLRIKPNYKDTLLILGKTKYKLVETMSVKYLDATRPEIPWHAFSQEEANEGQKMNLYVYDKLPDNFNIESIEKEVP